ncbi:replicative DNA helicase [Candidatus Bipolaricaulota bacterium]
MDATRIDRTDVRELPKNIEAEQVVLGAAILEPESTIPILVEKLFPEHFYERRHRVIFRTIRELFDRGEPSDIVLLANRLEETGDMERAGGRMYLNELLDRTTTTASLEYYADIVKRKATLRSLIEAGGRISELGFDEVNETDEILDRAEALIFDISSRDTGGSYFLISDFLYEHIDTLEKLHRDPSRHTVTGFSTGFPYLDSMTAGMQRSDLVIIAGRPGTGKTSYLLSLARHMAIRDNAKIGIFSLEMKKEHLLERLLCGEGKVNLHHLRGGYVPGEKWRDLAHAASKLQKAQIIVDDTPGISILEVRARARRMAAQHGLDVVMLDYLQLVEGGIRADRREQEVAYISRSLKKLARELNICVLAASQLNRSPEGRTEKRPRLADLRESGAIEQDADIVMFIYREDYHRQQDEGGTGAPSDASAPSELIIAKQRNGPVGNVEIMFHKAYASFYPVVGE